VGLFYTAPEPTRQTDGRTPYRYIDPALRTMRAVAINDAYKFFFALLLHVAKAASELQLLKPGTLSLHLSAPVPVLIPSVVTSRPTIASKPSNMLNALVLVPRVRQTTVCIYKRYLLTTVRPTFSFC